MSVLCVLCVICAICGICGLWHLRHLWHLRLSSVPSVASCLADLRESIRSLRRAPLSSLVIVGTLAAVIGANTAVFSLLNAVWLRTVDVPAADRLVAVTATNTEANRPGYFYADTVDAFRAEQDAFSGLSMYWSGVRRVEVRDGPAQDVGVEGVTPGYFEMLGVRMALGRSLAGLDTGRTGTAGVVISDRLWRRALGADRRVIGETIAVDAEPVTIVGVAPPGFVGLDLDSASDVFLPLAFARRLAGDASRPFRAPTLVGRLADGVTLRGARAEVLGRWPGVQAATFASLPPAVQAGVATQTLDVAPLATGFSVMRREYGDSFLMLIALTSVLLLVGAVNVMGVMSAREQSRRHQTAVRLALGASRLRVFRQVLAEGLLLAVCALAAAMLTAWWATRVVTSMLSVARTLPLQRPFTPDGQVFAYAAGVTVLTGLAIAFWPAWRAAASPIDEAMRPDRTATRPVGRYSRIALVTQVALSLVLLALTGLFAGMLSHLRANEAPFDGRNIALARLARNPGDTGELGVAYYRNLVTRLSTIPGAQAVVLSTYFPAYLGYRGPLPTTSYTAGSAAGASPASAMTEYVTPGFFETFGIARLHGRDFTWDDDGQAPAVVVLSETLARRLFGETPAVGNHVAIDAAATRTSLTVVGIVADAAIGSIREPHQPVAFRPMMQELTHAQFPMAHVRTGGDPGAVRGVYTRLVESEGHQFVRGVFTLDEWLDNVLLQERLIAGIALSLAGLAMMLACVGTYGLLAQSVTARSREIGVRMSLGATHAAVVGIIVGHGLRVTIAGILIGVPCAMAAARLLRAFLYGVTPADLTPIVVAAGLLLVTALVASTVPAFRASRVDPVRTLRQG